MRRWSNKLQRLVQARQVAHEPGKGIVVRCALEDAIEALVSAVPVSSRAVLALRVYADLSYEEIAALLSVDVNEVTHRMVAAMERGFVKIRDSE